MARQVSVLQGFEKARQANFFDSPMTSGSLEFGKAEAEFVYLLNNEIEKFNNFFSEQEEDFVIRDKELKQRIQSVIDTWGPNGTQPSEVEYERGNGKNQERHCQFPWGNGAFIELQQWLAKILKKYDKRTAGLLRSPFIQKYSQCPRKEDEEGIRGEREIVKVLGEGIFRNTVAALLTMQEIRRGSSTYNHFSLPPLNLPDSDLIQSFQLNSPIPIP
ncbi:SPX domain protein 3 [Actinidia rufa]|uniref:SPX domain protein 3 n=1 Tax=Actinidia rufa TaxID=165716 RepID=A0A7J0DJL1_9ERIC|nr:SPX domain protein 3 [Actinidia rufa]